VSRLALGAGVCTLATFVLALGATFAAPTVVHSPIRPEAAWRWVFVVALVACFVALLAGLWLLRRGGAPLAAVLAIAAAIQLVPLGTPLLMSTDVYGYWEYGWIGAVAGKNPYDHLPREFLDNPAHVHRGDAWTDWPLYYGPLFVAASEAQAKLVDSRAGVVAFYKLGAALAMLTVVVLTAVCARRKAYAAAFVGWNPLLAMHFAGGGHNDAWMMALFLGALVLWRRGNRDAGAALWVWSIAIKWVPLMWLPLDAAANRRRPPRLPWLGLGVGAGVLASIATWRFGLSWLDAFVPIRQQVELYSSTSVPFHVSKIFDLPQVWVRRGFFGLFVLAYGWLLVQAWRGRSRRGLAAGLLLCSVAWLGPWYVLWCLPLAVIEEDRLAQGVGLGLTAFLLRDALPIPWFF
jgi:hypothetical protein